MVRRNSPYITNVFTYIPVKDIPFRKILREKHFSASSVYCTSEFLSTDSFPLIGLSWKRRDPARHNDRPPIFYNDADVEITSERFWLFRARSSKPPHFLCFPPWVIVSGAGWRMCNVASLIFPGICMRLRPAWRYRSPVLWLWRTDSFWWFNMPLMSRWNIKTVMNERLSLTPTWQVEK